MAFRLADYSTNNRTIPSHGSSTSSQGQSWKLAGSDWTGREVKGQLMELMLVATGFLSLLWLTQTLVRRNLDNRKDP